MWVSCVWVSCVWVSGGKWCGRRRREEEKDAAGGSTQPKTRTPHKDVGKNSTRSSTFSHHLLGGGHSPNSKPQLDLHFGCFTPPWFAISYYGLVCKWLDEGMPSNGQPRIWNILKHVINPSTLHLPFPPKFFSPQIFSMIPRIVVVIVLSTCCLIAVLMAIAFFVWHSMRSSGAVRDEVHPTPTPVLPPLPPAPRPAPAPVPRDATQRALKEAVGLEIFGGFWLGKNPWKSLKDWMLGKAWDGNVKCQTIRRRTLEDLEVGFCWVYNTQSNDYMI